MTMTLGTMLVAAEQIFIAACILALIILWRRGEGRVAQTMGPRWLAIIGTAIVDDLADRASADQRRTVDRASGGRGNAALFPRKGQYTRRRGNALCGLAPNLTGRV